MATDPCYTIIRAADASEAPTADALKQQLERGNDESKVGTMKRILRGMINGEPYANQLLMHVIRFVMPSNHKPLKKLLHLYWEIVPKHNPDGKLKQEMILVCNALRNDLQHPNEYVRGASLRMVCKLRDPELLEPLVPSCRQNLDHKHPYVRKNAILAVYFSYKFNQVLIPDAPKIISELLAKETDMACRRNAFVMLENSAPDLAISYLATVAAQIPKFDENVQLAIIELVRKEARTNPDERPRYLKLLHALLSSPELSVKYEAATSFTSLTSHPDAIGAAASCYVTLLTKSADTNVKLIVLEQISDLVSTHERVGADDLPVELLRVLATPDMEVRRKATKIVLSLINSRNVDSVVGVLKKELAKASGEAGADSIYSERAPEYRQLLIQTIHNCAVRFPAVAAQVVYVLMDYLADSSNASAVDVVAFVREVVQRFPDLRNSIITKLLGTLNDLKSGKVARGVLWIIGEYVPYDYAMRSLEAIKSALGDVVTKPLEPSGVNSDETETPGDSQTATSNALRIDTGAPPASTTSATAATQPARTSNRVLADGSYATQTALTTTNAVAALSPIAPGADGRRRPPLQALLQNGDYFTGAVLATALTKLALRVHSMAHDPSFSIDGSPTAKTTLDVLKALANRVTAESMFILTCVLKQGMSATLDEDSFDRIQQCLATLASEEESMTGAGDAVHNIEVRKVYLDECRAAFARVLAVQDARNAKKVAKVTKAVGVEDAIMFSLLKPTNGGDGDNNGDLDLDSYEQDLSRATGIGATANDMGSGNNNGRKADNQLSRVVQLTGFSDPVYAEAYVNVHQFDILLDVLLVNQTGSTLQNMTVEFSTLGDLKLVERPAPVTLAAKSYHTLKANIKVSSTETGVIFGTITYDLGSQGSRTVNLADIHIDIMDYIHPAQCTETQFRSMWTEFEWENKINVHYPGLTDLREYLDTVMSTTNMACLTPESALGGGDCGVLAANLYARSVFGEDALANVCIERSPISISIVGHIRIRAKTQGIALSLGDKITLSQKNAANAVATSTAASSPTTNSNNSARLNGAVSA